MAPIHPFICIFASAFQIFNSTSIGGWLAGYGPTTVLEWEGRMVYIQLGMIIFAAGLLANIYHDDELREIRRAAARNEKKREQAQGEKVKERKAERIYMVPQNGLFQYILYPHYFCEWIEWCGFWIIGGWGCIPARIFVINEIATMTPRAVKGKKWYIERFGREKIGNRSAVLPGIL